MGEGSERAMRAARSWRLAAGLLALSVFSCSYGDREDKEEDDENKRTAWTPPTATIGPGPSGSPVPQWSSIVHSRA